MPHEMDRLPTKRFKKSGVELEEEKAWVDFYRRVGDDATLAREVLNQLESDPVMKRIHLALLLCCKDSLRKHKARQARNARIGQFVRWICRKTFIDSFTSSRKRLKDAGELAVECLPETQKEPAIQQVRSLRTEPGLDSVEITFQKQFRAPSDSATQGDSTAKTARRSAA